PNAENAALSAGAVAALGHLGVTVSAFNWVAFGILCIVTLATLALALALAWRRSDDWMALLVSLFLINYVIANVGTSSVSTTTTSASALAVVIAVAQSTPSFVITFAVLLLFPSGRFAPRWSWIILVADTLWVITLAAAPALFNGPLILGYPFAVGTAIACIIYRYRRASTPVQRQQTKWIVVGLVTTLLANQLYWLPLSITPLGQTLYAPASFLIYQLLLLITPITFFIAVQRYRLYDIDTIINRALVYGALTAVLVGVYAAGVIEAQALVDALTHQSGRPQPIVIVATTLLIAALFRPLRDYLQALVDRRFYRSKYDAAKMAAAFSATLRQDIDLTTLQEHLLDVVERTVQPSQAFLWLTTPRSRPGEPRHTDSQTAKADGSPL
ncbi:MAG TPA: hypothetical protein VF812_10355, partial [Ktedonobacterales bacterium]